MDPIQTTQLDRPMIRLFIYCWQSHPAVDLPLINLFEPVAFQILHVFLLLIKNYLFRKSKFLQIIQHPYATYQLPNLTYLLPGLAYHR